MEGEGLEEVIIHDVTECKSEQWPLITVYGRIR
jgi:hypothetical protein